MTGITGANNPDDSVALDDLAEFTPALNRSSNFHILSNLFFYFVDKYKPSIMFFSLQKK